MSLTVIELAYAKVNLSLLIGPTRPDGRHELVTVFDSVRLADELIVSTDVPAGGDDEVICDGVPGPNLVSDALAGLRAVGWPAPPVRVEIWKRIPVAAGMGGGSADAAALLRCARRVAPIDADTVYAVAGQLGADVPAQVLPGPSLGTGAGDVVAPLERLAPYAVLVLPQPFALSTADVYREADRLGVGRTADELAAVHARLAEVLPGPLPDELAINDLQAAALSLAPEISGALEAALAAGADRAMVCGSGPTVIGIFAGEEGARRAHEAAADAALAERFPGIAAATPVHSSQFKARL